MLELSTDFRDLLELLNRHGARYLVVDGFAVMIHAKPRYTKDLDLWLECSADNTAKRAVGRTKGLGDLEDLQ